MRWFDRLVKLCAMVAGYMLFGIMLFITVSVAFRYALGNPIFGSQDVMEMMLIAATTLGLAYCARTNGHVGVDLFENMLGRAGCLVGDILARVIGAALLLMLTWASVVSGLDAFEWGDATNLLRIPYWPFYVVIVISALLYAVALIAESVQLLRTGQRTEFEQ